MEFKTIWKQYKALQKCYIRNKNNYALGLRDGAKLIVKDVIFDIRIARAKK